MSMRWLISLWCDLFSNGRQSTSFALCLLYLSEICSSFFAFQTIVSRLHDFASSRRQLRTSEHIELQTAAHTHTHTHTHTYISTRDLWREVAARACSDSPVALEITARACLELPVALEVGAWACFGPPVAFKVTSQSHTWEIIE